ncbi:MAG TPA: class I SAM-dependent methyltransferase [Gammaproteobacteria bacterium]|nr:class I SAM-dependent methyltransferase [Gammaproteobacteria bacterium]
MSGPDASKGAAVAGYYDRAAADVPAFTVLNYGYADIATDSRVPPEHPEKFCLALYEHTVRDTPLAGARVLEVSCGRGGGASFLMQAFDIGEFVGVDLSPENIRIARERNDGPQFMLGDAQQLEFDDADFDVVINIEAAHLYDDRRRFFAEVHRVLKPSGHFCYTDGYWANDNCVPELLDAGFDLRERREITDNVIAALDLDNARRLALFEAMPDKTLIEEYKDWAGVVGYRAWNRFVSRETRYFSHLLRKPL